MMRKVLFLLIGGALILIPSMTLAVDQTFEGGVLDVATDPGFAVYQRYYLPTFADVSKGCPNTCGTACDTVTAGGPYCQMGYKKKSTGFRGYADNLFNYGNAPSGSMTYMVVDAESNGGTANHAGFYAWTAKAVTSGETGKWNDPACSGVNPLSCLGPANNSNAADVLNVPDVDGGGAGLQHIGGLRPMPVPRVNGFDGTNFNLGWDAATAAGDTAEAQYDLYYAVSAPNAGACDAPLAGDLTFLRTEVGNSATVTMGDVGLAPGDEQCVTFAMKLRFPPASGTEVVSRFFSANGQSTYTGQGGLSVKIVGVNAGWVGRNNVEVSWKTSLEDGVVGFYVTRSFTADGTFQRVSDLIRANGEPSAYSFIDTVNARRGPVSGVFYRIEALDIDDEISTSAVTQLQLPEMPNVEKKIREFRRPVRGR